MKIEEVRLNNFRGARELVVTLSDAQTSVLVGANGAGKSTVLDCIAILLSRLSGAIRSGTARGRNFAPSDISNGANFAAAGIWVRWSEKEYFWGVTRARAGRTHTNEPHAETNLRAATSLATEIREGLTSNEEASIPVMVYYPVNRAVLDIPLRIRKRHAFDQVEAYDDSLTGASNAFRLFFEWFRTREDLENERRLDEGGYRDPQLEAVRIAVESLMPGYSELRVRRSPLRMTLSKEGEEVTVNQLSDGEKCLLALVGDLARRLAIANPRLSDPLRGKGVVLIDEIELHLHATWQRAIVPALERTFGNCQFIVSTHSAPILGHIAPNSVFLLSREGGNVVSRPLTTYGQDTDRILEEVFGAPARPQEVEDDLRRLFAEIDQNDLRAARDRVARLEDDLGMDDPEIVKAKVMIRRKELIRG